MYTDQPGTIDIYNKIKGYSSSPLASLPRPRKSQAISVPLTNLYEKLRRLTLTKQRGKETGKRSGRNTGSLMKKIRDGVRGIKWQRLEILSRINLYEVPRLIMQILPSTFYAFFPVSFSPP